MRTNCCDTSTDPKRTTESKTQNVVLYKVEESLTLDKNVSKVLVTGDDVEVTLPYQPQAGTTIAVSSTGTGTTVKPGCAGTNCGECEADEDACDTFCNEDDAITVCQCSTVFFTYFPGDACASPPVEGVWTTGPGPQGLTCSATGD